MALIDREGSFGTSLVPGRKAERKGPNNGSWPLGLSLPQQGLGLARSKSYFDVSLPCELAESGIDSLSSTGENVGFVLVQ